MSKKNTPIDESKDPAKDVRLMDDYADSVHAVKSFCEEFETVGILVSPVTRWIFDTKRVEHDWEDDDEDDLVASYHKTIVPAKRFKITVANKTYEVRSFFIDEQNGWPNWMISLVEVKGLLRTEWHSMDLRLVTGSFSGQNLHI